MTNKERALDIAGQFIILNPGKERLADAIAAALDEKDASYYVAQDAFRQFMKLVSGPVSEEEIRSAIDAARKVNTSD